MIYRDGNVSGLSDSSDALCLWMCPNCGQTHFGANPPDMCDFCADFTTWREYHLSPPRPHARSHGAVLNEPRWIQLPLPLIYYDD